MHNIEKKTQKNDRFFGEKSAPLFRRNINSLPCHKKSPRFFCFDWSKSSNFITFSWVSDFKRDGEECSFLRFLFLISRREKSVFQKLKNAWNQRWRCLGAGVNDLLSARKVDSWHWHRADSRLRRPDHPRPWITRKRCRRKITVDRKRDEKQNRQRNIMILFVEYLIIIPK